MPVDSKPLGFEIVGAELGLELHSWHCHGYRHDVERELGVGSTCWDSSTGMKTPSGCSPGCLPVRDEAPLDVPWVVVQLAQLDP